jgi:hypothetical protein
MNLTILLSDQTPDDVVMSFAVHLVRKAIVGNGWLFERRKNRTLGIDC